MHMCILVLETCNPSKTGIHTLKAKWIYHHYLHSSVIKVLTILREHLPCICHASLFPCNDVTASAWQNASSWSLHLNVHIARPNFLLLLFAAWAWYWQISMKRNILHLPPISHASLAPCNNQRMCVLY